MKNLILTFGLLISTLSFAETREIWCQKKPGSSKGVFTLYLDNSGMRQAPNYFKIRQADWGFSYSFSGLMHCSNQSISLNGNEKFRCVGYANREWLVEITVELKDGEGSAKVHNIDDNLYADDTEGMVLPCKIKGL